MGFGRMLRELRKAKHMGIRKLSDRLGYDRSYLSRIENDAVTPSSEFIRRAARLFSISVETLRIAAGKLPKDIAEILSDHPEEAACVLRDAFTDPQANGNDHRSNGATYYVDGQAINSPFRYAGGKFYARKLILAHLPSHTAYVEPFVGGGSIFFAKPKVKANWLNDVDEELMNCYVQIRDHPEGLIGFLRGLKASKSIHVYFKNEFKWSNELERAGRWYYLNRTSYSGIMNMQNCFWGYGDKYSMRPENWPTNIYRTSHKLQGVKLTCSDFEKVISETPEGAFLFIDPPYFNADQDKFYTHSFEVEDHYRLARLLKARRERLRFLLTYDDSPEIREIYGWAKRIVEGQWNYTINRTDDQTGRTVRRGTRYKGHELFIMNYQDDLLDLFGELELVNSRSSS